MLVTDLSGKLKKIGNPFLLFVLPEFEKLLANSLNILLAKEKKIQHGSSDVYYRSHRLKIKQGTGKSTGRNRIQ